jgi:hypothetical protein
MTQAKQPRILHITCIDVEIGQIAFIRLHNRDKTWEKREKTSRIQCGHCAKISIQETPKWIHFHSLCGTMHRVLRHNSSSKLGGVGFRTSGGLSLSCRLNKTCDSTRGLSVETNDVASRLASYEWSDAVALGRHWQTSSG